MGTINFRKDVFKVLQVKINKNQGRGYHTQTTPESAEERGVYTGQGLTWKAIWWQQILWSFRQQTVRAGFGLDLGWGLENHWQLRQEPKWWERNTVMIQSFRFTSLAEGRASNQKLLVPEDNRGNEVAAFSKKVIFLFLFFYIKG